MRKGPLAHKLPYVLIKGYLTYDLRNFLVGAGPGRGGGAANGAAAFGSFAASSFPGAPASSGAAVFGSGNRDFESLTLMKMRQKAERERLIAEMTAKDTDD